jgi:FixJ family two-component response regulator
MKPVIALIDHHKHAAKSLGLLLNDHGYRTLIGSDALDILLQDQSVGGLGLIMVEQGNSGGGLADGLALREALSWTVPIILMASRFDLPPSLEGSVPALHVVPTPTESDVLIAAVRKALAPKLPIGALTMTRRVSVLGV